MIPLDIRIGVVIVYAVAGAMAPALAFANGEYTIRGIALAGLVTAGIALLSVFGSREAGRRGAFLKFRPWAWYVVPHVSWAVGVATGVLVAYSALPIQ